LIKLLDVLSKETKLF